jgi:spermidine/putrescine transport system ATP-binding protein
MVADVRLIQLEHVTKVFGEDVTALDDVSLYIRQREFVTLLGPSGCGKTTMLRLIAGFEMPTSGRIFINGADVDSIPPYRRPVNTVFQRYALFPHLNVADNIAFGLRIKKLDRAVIARKVGDMLALVGLSGYERRSVDALSGGQQQRVAIARALVGEPEVLLLDEPLGALDLKLRKGMQMELKSMQQKLGITFIYVTHDQEEALTMSDTIVVMRGGRIQQIGRPTDIYNEPRNAFVADFIGESNIIPGVMRADRRVVLSGREFACVDGGFAPGEAVSVVVRPEDILLTAESDGFIRGSVRSVIFKGVHYEIMVDGDDGFQWMIHSTASRDPGDRVGMRIEPDGFHIMRGEAKP